MGRSTSASAAAPWARGRANGGRTGRTGTTVNLPTRAVTGHNWTGEELDWRRAPDQYDAIHFHADDLDDARWETDFTLTVPSDLPSGAYAARLPC